MIIFPVFLRIVSPLVYGIPMWTQHSWKGWIKAITVSKQKTQMGQEFVYFVGYTASLWVMLINLRYIKQNENHEGSYWEHCTIVRQGTDGLHSHYLYFCRENDGICLSFNDFVIRRWTIVEQKKLQIHGTTVLGKGVFHYAWRALQVSYRAVIFSQMETGTLFTKR